ncbi:hypothetical protein GCM10009777_32770 [Microbacterium pumilum]|uniref:Uncharacterized protein n=1 Tax=Microbacterium pumilum TaxID=344165 RepID=A0ABN2SY02_9MICO
MFVRVGDVLADRDRRRPGRTVEVIEHVDTETYRIRVLTHPVKPEAVGTEWRIGGKTLSRWYEPA